MKYLHKVLWRHCEAVSSKIKPDMPIQRTNFGRNKHTRCLYSGISGIAFFLVDCSQIAEAAVQVEDCYRQVATIEGIFQFYLIVSKSGGLLIVY